MMNFPASVVFTPYSVLRNLSEQPVSVAPTLWWMQSGTAQSAELPQLTLAPHQTVNLDVGAALAAAGLKNYQGNFNLVLNTTGPRGAVLLDAGSVDQSYTYVFEAAPRGTGQSASKGLQYWSTANGDDTMVTLWNPADEPQDFVFTLFYTGGHYLYTIHLEARASHTFNVSNIVHSSIPDAQGNVVPAGVQSGSAEIAGPLGENQDILVAIDAGIYNVRKATCGNEYCTQCNGEVNASVAANPFAIPVGDSVQETFQYQYNTGTQYDVTSTSSWSSSNTSVATVSSGLTSGVSPGPVTVVVTYYTAVPQFMVPCQYGAPPPCQPNYISPTGSGGGSVLSVSFSPNPALIPAGGTGTVTAVVSGNSNNGTITLTLATTPGAVGATGSAVFISGSPPTQSSSLTITGNGNNYLTIKGIQGSTNPGDITITATAPNGEGGTETLATGTLSVVALAVQFQDSSGKALASPFRVGISSTVTDCNGNSVTRDKTQTIQAVISPTWETPNIGITQNKGSGGIISINVTATDVANGIITMTVVGTTQSNDQGDVQIIATDNAVGTSSSHTVSVIVPSQIATPHPQPSQPVSGINTYCNACSSPTGIGLPSGDVQLITDYTIHMSITVWDQFGGPVGDLYAKAPISETFNSAIVPINQLLTANSTYTDPFGLVVRGAVVASNDPQVAAWPSQPELAFIAGAGQTVLSQPVQVDGFAITPIMNRAWATTGPPNTVTVTWP